MNAYSTPLQIRCKSTKRNYAATLLPPVFANNGPVCPSILAD